MNINTKIFTTLIIAAFLLIIGIVLRYTQAADLATTAEVQNTPPSVDSIRIATTAYGADDLTSTGILPNVGTTRTIHINGIISDSNGEDDIASSTVNLVFHKTTATNTCTEDNNDCYKVTSCTTDDTAGDDTQIAYNCEVAIHYYIDATDTASIYADDNWTAYVEVEDLATAQGTLTATIEVLSLLALNLPDAIDYGTRSLAEQSSAATNVETILTQRGNTKADVQLSGASMSCDQLGSLPVSAQAWALTDTDYTSSAVLSGTPAAAERNIDLRTDDNNELTANLYWNIAIPASGVKGTCTGNNTISIIAVPVASAIPTDADGNTYGTVNIGTQTWLDRNMNVGTMVTNTTTMTNNSILEKYCYDNSEANCTNDGAFYQWDEAMQYVTTEGTQGICPAGYHIPTDNEFKTLEIFLGMTQGQADGIGWRGNGQGTKLKVGGSSGFNAPLSGLRSTSGSFISIGAGAALWSSTVSGSSAWRRLLDSGNAQVYRNTYGKTGGLSVRCLKD